MPLRGMDDSPVEQILAVLEPSIAVKADRRFARFEFGYFASGCPIFGVSGSAPAAPGARPPRLSEHGPAAHELLVAESQARRSVRVVSGALAAVVRWSVPGVALVQRRAL